MPVANAMQERHPALFNRYPFEPAINLLYAPTCGRSGNKAEFPPVKSDIRAGIRGPGFSCCSRPIVGIVPHIAYPDQHESQISSAQLGS